jgi:DNA-binding MarR family transcriptional regulator
MPGDVLDRLDADGTRREEAVETLRYALNGLLSAVRTDRVLAAGRLGADRLHRHRILAALSEHALTPEDLARVVALDPPVVRARLDELGREGLVEAVRAGRGRTATTARLTPEGLRALHELEAVFRSLWEKAVADLPDEDLRVAARVLSRVAGVIVPT